MHPQTMQSVVDSMLSQYKEYGISEASYSTYKTGYCAPVIRFCIERNSGMYSRRSFRKPVFFRNNRLQDILQGTLVFSTAGRRSRRCLRPKEVPLGYTSHSTQYPSSESVSRMTLKVCPFSIPSSPGTFSKIK